MQAISSDLQRSAQQLNDSARMLSGAVQEFNATDAGSHYTARGEQVSRGLEGLSRRMFMWANCVNDTGAAVGQAAVTNGQVDQGSGAAIAQNSVNI
ncbi:hypothetical protein C8258_30160 [Nocardia sp. MDA0666]|nr:hypothetical protein C8258_30160 [Nocardia sp. MDA0666]